MVGGEDFFKDTNDDFSSGKKGSSFGSPSERTPMIEAAFEKVLGRKPTSRELSFYKYGIMSEADIIEKLLTGNEHKKLVEDARKLPNTEDQLKDAEIEVKKLNQKIKDVADEGIELNSLLDERNRTIHTLRDELQNPYNLPTQVERFEEGFDVYRTPYQKDTVLIVNESIIEKVRKFLIKLLS